MKNHIHFDYTDSLTTFSGKIDYPLMNDYMFRSVMQSNERVLKGLLCSLLHLTPDDIHSTEILNPIELGATIEQKDFHLDIKILMNNNTVMNLEMQLNNEYNWPERSLVYLCRLFDGLNVGEDYKYVKPAFQIGILNFTLFPNCPEFFSTYQMMNVAKYQKYSDKFTIHVLDLTQIHLATEEDKRFHLDGWAKLFKALTWEDFKMIASDNKSMQEAGETLFTLNRDNRIRYQCETRERYRREWNTVKLQMQEYESTIAEKDSVIAEKNSVIAELEAKIIKLQEQISSHN